MLIINSIAFLYYKKAVENSILNEIFAYIELYSFGNISYPAYIKIKKEDELLENYEFLAIARRNNLIAYVDKNYLDRKYIKFYINILLWDTVIIIALFLFFHYTIIRYIRKEKNIREALEITILSISHKLGNFLAINRTNIELLREKYSGKEIDRLLNSYSVLEKDFKHVSMLLKELDSMSSKKIVNVKTIIEKNIKELKPLLNDKKLIINLNDFYIRTDSGKLNIVIQNLLENAFKFSKSFIHIKFCSNNKGQAMLIIRNDINESIRESTGIGLKIVEKLVPDIKGKLIYRAKKNKYITLLKIQK